MNTVFGYGYGYSAQPPYVMPKVDISVKTASSRHIYCLGRY